MDLSLGNTLSKSERLYCRKDISELLARGKYGNLPGMRYCIRKETGAPQNRILVSVPKKYFKRAVKRNLLKRRIRESFRLQKSALPSGGGVDIMFIYNTKEVLSFSEIKSLVGQVLEIASK